MGIFPKTGGEWTEFSAVNIGGPPEINGGLPLKFIYAKDGAGTGPRITDGGRLLRRIFSPVISGGPPVIRGGPPVIWADRPL